MNDDFPKVIIGQEAICPDGLGRVSGYYNNFSYQYIRVETYFNNCSGEWDYKNVELIDPRK